MISEYRYDVAPGPVFMRYRRHRKERERNIITALLSIVVIATLATSIAHPRWFFLKGGGCNHKYIGIQEFLSGGCFQSANPPKDEPSAAPYPKSLNYFDINEVSHPKEASNEAPAPRALIYSGLNEALRDCVTPAIVNLLRSIAALCFLAILCSLGQFFLDTVGVAHKWLIVIRRNAVGSVLTVLNCVSIIGLCYYVATLMEQQQEMTKPSPSDMVQVKFDIGYYLVAIAGSVAVVASAINLLRSYPRIEERGEGALLDDYDGAETFSVGISHSQVWPYYRDASQLRTVPPPPPYTP